MKGVYAACLSIVKSRSSLHTVQAMRAILLASATAALLCPRRFSTCSAQVYRGFLFWDLLAAKRQDRAPWISSQRSYSSPCLLMCPS